jgi:protein-S-isoprenylcysteine O-methyltransferase Ste14
VLALKVPPLVVVGLTGVLMWCAASLLPALGFVLPARLSLAAAVGLAGVMLSATGVVAFRRAGTTIDPTRPDASTALVRTGIYAHTRNPMYVGFLLVLTAWAIFLSNGAAFVFLPIFLAYMNRFQITPEEKVLAERFGQEFAAYKARVRRWL